MNRRLFLNQSSRVALTAALLPAIACQTTTDKPAAGEATATDAASQATEPFAL